MEDKIKNIMERIEEQIKYSKDDFEEWNVPHALKIGKIYGMIEALAMLTEKEYYFDKNGLHER